MIYSIHHCFAISLNFMFGNPKIPKVVKAISPQNTILKLINSQVYDTCISIPKNQPPSSILKYFLSHLAPLLSSIIVMCLIKTTQILFIFSTGIT